MPPAQRPVDISPRNGSRSSSTTSFTPRAARWYAVLAPITPPPTTTASAVLGISVARTSDQVGHYLGQWLPDPDHERDLLLDVPPGRRIAEAADAVDDPVELVGLERQDPLPIGEPERAGGVGEDVGVGPESGGAVEAANRNRVCHLLEGHLPFVHGLLDRGRHVACSTEHRVEGVHGLVAHGRSSPSWPR